jgi:hypothetical protein
LCREIKRFVLLVAGEDATRDPETTETIMMLYLGPDTVMPLASAIAAVVGVAVMFWHKTVGAFKSAFRWIGRLVGRRS